KVQLEAAALLRLLFPDERPFSPSELETFAACGFRYFGQRILQLDERDPDRTRLHYGSLLHRVLQTFYGSMRETASDAGPMAAVQRDQRARLLELFEAECRQLDDDTLPPELDTLFRAANGVLDLFFEVMEQIEGEAKLGNLLTEYELPKVLLGKDRDGRAVHL